MAAPASYTEPGLALYMHATLGKVAEALGYTAPTSYQEAVNTTLLALGLTDIAQATDMGALRAVAAREAWRKAASDAAAYFDFSADGASYTRSQLFAAIQNNQTDAEAAASAYVADDNRYTATVGPATFRDPYNWRHSDAEYH